MSSTNSASRSTSAIIQELNRLKTSPSKLTELLKSLILSPKEYAGFRTGMTVDEAQSFIDILDQTLGTMLADSEFYHKCLRVLRKICGETTLLPASLMISEGLEKVGDAAVASGGFANVWKGTYQGREVAIKAFRVFQDEDVQRVKKLYCKEVVVWRRLSHENVVPFLGVSSAVSKLSIVSDWMPNGTIGEYLKTHNDANRLGLLLNVVNGLQFLHKAKVVHGDLKGDNILINEAGNACLTDFGLTSITTDPLSMNASSARSHGSVRWMAPELLNPDYPDEDLDGPTETSNSQSPIEANTLDYPVGSAHRPTTQSDMYALAMVVIEVTSGRLPFYKCRNEQVLARIMDNKRPNRPRHAVMSDEIWELIQACWSTEPVKRPGLDEVIRRLERAANPPDQRPSETPSISATSTHVVLAAENESEDKAEQLNEPAKQMNGPAEQFNTPAEQPNQKAGPRPSFIQRLAQKYGCVQVSTFEDS